MLKQGGIGAGSDKPAFWRTDQWHLQEVALLQIRLRWLLASAVLLIIYVPLLCLPCANSCIRRSPGGGHRKQNCDNWIASCWYFPINICSGYCKIEFFLKKPIGLISGVIFGMFSGQPLIILGSTGPLYVFEKILYSICKDHDWDYLGLRMWVGLWVGAILFVIVAMDASAYICYVTRWVNHY